jgi:ribulose-5-phosphate 4-epimerase/fuculose-1-phosphate aldolase
MTDKGQKVRTDVAEAYRLVKYYGFDDVTHGFVSARVQDDDLIIGGYGVLLRRANQSSLHNAKLTDASQIRWQGNIDMMPFISQYHIGSKNRL